MRMKELSIIDGLNSIAEIIGNTLNITNECLVKLITHWISKIY